MICLYMLPPSVALYVSDHHRKCCTLCRCVKGSVFHCLIPKLGIYLNGIVYERQVKGKVKSQGEKLAKWRISNAWAQLYKVMESAEEK